MKYSGHRKILCEFSKLTSSDTKRTHLFLFRPKRTGFNMYAEYTRPQLTFLALVPCLCQSIWFRFVFKIPILRVFTEITSFPSDFRTSTQHFYASETSLTKIYSSDRAYLVLTQNVLSNLV